MKAIRIAQLVTTSLKESLEEQGLVLGPHCKVYLTQESCECYLNLELQIGGDTDFYYLLCLEATYCNALTLKRACIGRHGDNDIAEIDVKERGIPELAVEIRRLITQSEKSSEEV